ncbi:hypothetical protein BU16DRAFT_456049 [Lophium mytilinum]|uniref:Uncharacterized protein n=1 Tax=Lophium mytilinum TaxID=390894 RepID=A0A6A6R3B3_9PEZI|nr:hypothetical protein BU16DRAFT_456049 [Lophium mytilinum]
MKPVLLSEAEYEALPIPVQRKYFSSLERLRIAEGAFRPQPQRSTSIRQSTFHPNGLTTSGTRARRRLRKQQSIRQEYNISQAEAQWFLSLPEKVRRRHFSREEQVLLAGRCETYILDPADEQLYHEQTESYQDLALKDYDRLQERVELFEDKEGTPARGRSRKRSFTHDSVLNNSTDDKDEETFIHFDEMPPPEAPREHRSRRSSFRRTLSLTAIPFTRHSTSSAPPTSAPPFFSASQQAWRPRAQSNAGPRYSSEPSAPIYDPEAKHYQDPEARMKLRLYLASPQKFDEAIEFGFPSTGANSVAPQLELPKEVTHARKISHDVQTFLKDDKISFLEDHDDIGPESPPDSDDESMGELESPVTPSDPTPFHPTRLPSSNFSSLDSAGLPPFHPMHGRSKTQELYSQAINGNREMTLRMTLTRPDLRSDEDALYGWQAHRGTNADPLALEELNLTDDMTGSRGAFAVKSTAHKGFVSRFFNKVKTLQKA